jgi:glycosyltransferase involved in cell wall biosynthesis
MKIIHIGWYNPQPVGGVGKAILEQTKVLHAMGHLVEIWHFTPDVTEPSKMECTAPFPVWQIPTHNSKFFRCLSLSGQARQWIDTRLQEVRLFHIHSVFIPENALIAKLGKPYILTPNGGWSDVVLNGKRKWAKRLWILAIESRMWRMASSIQAVSVSEAKELSKHRGMAPIHYIPNGTEIPYEISQPEERNCFLFIGRLDINQKGLDLLFEALRIIKDRQITIPKVIVAGPDYRDGRAFLEKFRVFHGLSDIVEIRGVVHGKEKESLFRSAKLFIHTSRWEGLPLVLLEAIAHGIPCLLTPGTNVAAEWKSAGCAFETTLDSSAIAEYLIFLSKQSLDKESRIARELAKSDYSWTSIVGKLSNLYDYVQKIH